MEMHWGLKHRCCRQSQTEIDHKSTLCDHIGITICDATAILALHTVRAVFSRENALASLESLESCASSLLNSWHHEAHSYHIYRNCVITAAYSKNQSLAM